MLFSFMYLLQEYIITNWSKDMYTFSVLIMWWDKILPLDATSPVV